MSLSSKSQTCSLKIAEKHPKCIFQIFCKCMAVQKTGRSFCPPSALQLKRENWRLELNLSKYSPCVQEIACWGD